MAIGPESKASDTDTLAIGPGAVVTGRQGTAVGPAANSSAVLTSALGCSAKATGERAVALGVLSAASGDESVALGASATASGYRSISIGRTGNCSGETAIAIGTTPKVTATNAIVIGTSAISEHVNSVAIGRLAKTTAANQIMLGTANDSVVVPGVLKPNTLELKNLHLTGNLVVDGVAVLGSGTQATRTVLTYNTRSSDNTHLRSLEVGSGGDDKMYWGWQLSDLGITSRSSLLSDRRLKNVGAKFNLGLESIKQLQVYNYTFKNDTDKTPRVGVMAQDLMKIFPAAVTRGEDGFYRIRMEDIFYALINSVKELDIKITNLQNKDIASLKKQITELEKRNKALEQRISALEKRAG